MELSDAVERGCAVQFVLQVAIAVPLIAVTEFDPEARELPDIVSVKDVPLWRCAICVEICAETRSF